MAEAGWPRMAALPAQARAAILPERGRLVPEGRPAVPAAVIRRPRMRVKIELLRRSEVVLAALRRDGWAVESGQGDTLCARHPEVPNENAARSRLHGLGLLTSGSLRIEFCRAGPGEGTEQNS